MPSGGPQMHMRGFSAAEDQMLNTLVETEGPRWKAIAERMTAVTPDAPRTAAMVRNRFLRVQKGKKEAEQGKARNKCGLCGQLKKGHVCSADKNRILADTPVAPARVCVPVAKDIAKEAAAAVVPAATAAADAAVADAVTPPRTGSGLVLTPNAATAEADLPPIAESHLDVSEQDENAYSNSSSVLQLFAAGSGVPLIGTCDSQAGEGVAAAAAAEMQLAATCWSPLGSISGVEPSPDITMASLLAPTPEGMQGMYSFPNLPASLQAALTGAGLAGVPPAAQVGSAAC